MKLIEINNFELQIGDGLNMINSFYFLQNYYSTVLFMAVLCSRFLMYYIFVLWFLFLLSFFFSSPNLSRHRLDVCHVSTHDVA